MDGGIWPCCFVLAWLLVSLRRCCSLTALSCSVAGRQASPRVPPQRWKLVGPYSSSEIPWPISVPHFSGTNCLGLPG
ncbi:hypothetical protein B0J15DRAFT_479551 [Fusarium solani]|uniref:Secreted protein n=1 Tax=Fusarium solani TaxID=169388 RepID=A0A9P9RCB3_FUSSL|nr:uncharacterized protein B0J15DRAFT_479551 [Fusarium solani]KAH7274341.1 hypothetical protein B0J15DRAFT_479551 [Fusarium solani]